MSMQVTSFGDEDRLNEFLAQHKWRLGEIRLHVTDTPGQRNDRVDSISEVSVSLPTTRYYLLHPVIKEPLGQ
jgi:hypothetical protein